MKYEIRVDSRFEEEINSSILYYNSKQKGLGAKFYKEVIHHLSVLHKNPFFQIRYDEVRCIPLKIFPFMIHYSINESEKIIFVHAVISCYQNPEDAWIG